MEKAKIPAFVELLDDRTLVGRPTFRVTDRVLKTPEGRDELAALAKDELQRWLNRWRWLQRVGILEDVVGDVTRTLKTKKPNA
jgi:hypothetical protein